MLTCACVLSVCCMHLQVDKVDELLRRERESFKSAVAGKQQVMDNLEEQISQLRSTSLEEAQSEQVQSQRIASLLASELEAERVAHELGKEKMVRQMYAMINELADHKAHMQQQLVYAATFVGKTTEKCVAVGVEGGEAVAAAAERLHQAGGSAGRHGAQ